MHLLWPGGKQGEPTQQRYDEQAMLRKSGPWFTTLGDSSLEQHSPHGEGSEGAVAGAAGRKSTSSQELDHP